MKPLEYRFSLDMNDEAAQVFCNVRNGDDCSKLIVSLQEDGRAYTFDDDVHAYFLAKKSDGNSLYTECSVENNTIIYEFTEQTAPVSGTVVCQFLLLSGSNRLTTPIFRLEVFDNVSIDPDSPQSLPEYTALIDATQDAIDATDDMRDLIEEIEYKLEHGEFKGDPGPQGPQGIQGPQGAQGIQGPTGADGYSPTATVTKSGNTATITITDKNGTTTAEIEDGAESVADVSPLGTSSSLIPNIDTATRSDVLYRVWVDATSFENNDVLGWIICCGDLDFPTVKQFYFRYNALIMQRVGAVSNGVVSWEEWEATNNATVINEDTVPASVNWQGVIPNTYAGRTGQIGELALYADYSTFWYMADADPQNDYYEWYKVLNTDDLYSLMKLAPLNPTAAQIDAMANGQFYGDTVNHKGVVKGGQEFYDTEYIDIALALKAPLSDFNTLSERAVQPAFIISHSNLHGYSSANALAKNRAYAIYADVLSSEFSDLPAAAYGVTSYLMYYTSTSTRKQGIQLLNTPTDMWYRVVDGSGSGTWVPLTSSVQPANFLISHSNLHGYTDANSLDKNRVYAISADVTSSEFSNLPAAAYGALSYLTYYAYMDSRNHGVQLLQTATDMWYRTVSGSGSGTWVKIADVATVTSEIASAIESFAAKVVKSYGMTISHDETRGFTGANSLTQNNIYVIGSTVTSTEFTDLPSAAYGTTIYLLHYSYNATKKNGVQICTTSSKMWFRLVSNSAFGNWVELASQIDQNPNVTIDDYFVNTCVFKPISLDNNTGLFIFGDSITTDAHGGFTWGSLVAAKTGCTEYNFGVSGSAFVGYTAHPHTVMEQINSVPSGDWVNCDVCIVAAGTNDQKTENSAAGLRTAVQDVITAIKTNAPDAKIIFITPIRRESSGNNGLPMIAGAICNVALANECSVINGFDFPIPTHTNSWITELTDNDGLHPNVIGKKIYAQSVLNTLG